MRGSRNSFLSNAPKRNLMTFLSQNNKSALAVALLFLALCLSMTPFVASTEASSDNWSMYQHDPAHTGYTETSVATTLPKQLWNLTLEADASGSPSLPTIVDGFVYVGSSDALSCLDAKTGTTAWRVTVGNFAQAVPAISQGRVYASTIEGYLYCLDSATGNELWSVSISGQSTEMSPVVAGGFVFVETALGDVYCLDTSNGAIVWTFSTGASASWSCPAVDGIYLYVGNDEGDLFCLTASGGEPVWNASLADNISTLAVAGGRLFFGCRDGNAYCLNATDGTKLWNYTTEYNSGGPAHGYFWGNRVTAAAIAQNHIYVGSSNFQIYCLDASSGTELWNFTTAASVYAAPTIADNCVLAGSYDGNLYCLNATDGTQFWSYPAGVYSPVNAGGSAGPASIVDGTIYVVGNGVLYALGTLSESAEPVLLWLAVGLVVVLFAVLGLAVYLTKQKHRHT
jgi:outer membrane protein assembly factor BamB